MLQYNSLVARFRVLIAGWILFNYQEWIRDRWRLILDVVIILNGSIGGYLDVINRILMWRDLQELE